MKLEELIRQQAEEYLKTATRLATESALTGDIWLRVICREKSEVYSAAADGCSQPSTMRRMSHMADNIHYITWYTVYSAKTGEVVAAGTSSMCAAKLGYKTSNSFASSVGHRRHEKRRPYKYIFEQERIDRAEVDCLPPLRRYCKKTKREQEYER